jgi:prophage DNA circulation protein
MTWRDRLQPASFRGVPFSVDTDGLETGRRVQVHEYPQRDAPYVEDLGRKARRYDICGWLIGDDYMDQRDRLQQAVESAGKGELVHPQYGRIQVQVETLRLGHARHEGRCCRFDMTVHEAGEQVFPSSTPDNQAVVAKKADFLELILLEAFIRKCLTLTLQDFIAAGLNLVAGEVCGLIEDLTGLHGGLTLGLLLDTVGMLGSLTGDIPSLGGRFAGVFGSFTGNSPRSRLSAGNGMAALRALSALRSYHASTSAYSQATPSGRQMTQNADALSSFVRGSALSASARIAAATDWAVYDDAIAMRGTLAADFDGEIAVTESSTLFRALADLRSATVQAISAAAQDTPALTTVTPPDTIPAAVLAYQLYGDALRADEIVARNGVLHPGFVPSTPLKVLTT